MSVLHTWGSTATERDDAYPCDALVAEPRWAAFRAIDVVAPAHLVFRWLCQMRVAPYSYDLVDNLGRRSPRELTAGLGDPQPGDVVMTMFRVASAVRGRQITIVSDPPAGRVGDLLRRLPRSAITYRVVARGEGASRVVVKLVSQDPPGVLGRVLRAGMPLGDLVMMRRQLITFRTLAERDARRGCDPHAI